MVQDSSEVSDANENRSGRVGRTRMRLGLALMIVCLLIIAGRLVMIQGLNVGNMAEAAESQRTVKQVLPAVRGKIVDANGVVLAESILRFDIVISPKNNNLYDEYDHIVNTETLERVTYTRDQGLQQVATALGMKVETVKAAAAGDSDFAYILRDVSPQVEAKVMALRVPGIESQAQTKRVYPLGSVGGPIVGFLDSDGNGLAGIEQTQNGKLKGTDGKRTFQAGKNGIIIPTAPVTTIPAVNGETVKLTINQDIQYYAQQAAQQQKQQYSAEWASIVVGEVKTGKVLAIADSNSYNPNDPGKSAPADIGSRSVSAVVEPGSTDKAITASAVMQEGIFTPSSQFLVPPTLTVGGETFSDSFQHGTEKRTLAGIIADSMNTGTVMAGMKLTPEQRYDWMKKFGVGVKTGIDLPGESPGILTPWQNWDGRQEYTVLFGQGVAQTPLQTAYVFQTIANNGTRLKPQIIDSYTKADGSVDKVAQAKGTSVLTPKVAKDMRDMLEGVVTMTDYKVVNIPGYRTGGKTGTSEAPAENGKLSGYTSSFIGMAPMDDPQYFVAITVQRPQGSIYGVTQGYTFNQVMGQVLRTYDVPPSTTPSVKLPKFYK